jgi:hypothetical protein
MVGASFITAVAEVLRSKKGISANGNAQVDTAQSKFGGASAYFDGTDDYLVANGDFSQAGDFTIECWFRASRVTGVQSFMTIGNENTGRVTLYIDGSTLKYDTYGAGGTPKISATGTISTNTWYHIAAVRSGGTITIYRDGTSVGTGSSSGIVGNSTNAYFGAISDSNSDYQGHLDEIRYSNTARYTTTFTPATTPFVNDANTLLLIHADGTDASTFFEDDNGIRAKEDGFIVNTTNAYISTTQSKFGGSSVYTNNNTDGNDGVVSWDYNSSISPFNMNNYTNWTLEFWNRPTSYNTVNDPTGQGSVHSFVFSRAGSDGYVRMGFGFNKTGKLSFDYNNSGGYGGTTLQESTTSGALNTWQHIALVKQGTTYTLYHNGTSKASATITGTISLGTGSERPRLGGHVRGHPGYSDEFRVSNTARYTANFTPSTTAFVNDANTLLLMHADGTNNSTVVRDDNGASQRAAKHISNFGNAQIDTAQNKFGGAALLISSGSDRLETNPMPLGTGDFTLECWYRANTLSGDDNLIEQRTGSDTAPTIYTSGGTLFYAVGFTNRITGNALSTNTWYHIAVSRSSGTTRMFVNGTQVGSNYTDSNNYICAGNTIIGNYFGKNGSMDGWQDEIRISNSARYTANFTAPTAAFVNDANTLFLMHADGSDASTVFTDDNGGRSQKGVQAFGNAQIDTAQSKFGGASLYNDGTGDYIEVVNSNSFSLGTGNFTIELWWRATSRSGSYPPIITNYNDGYSADKWALFDRHDSYSTKFMFDCYNILNSGAILVSSTSVSNGTWYHLAIVRNGTTFTLYVNGTSEATYTSSASVDSGNYKNLFLGAVNGNYSNGHTDEIRISNSARYTANFTAPTAPFQNDANTLLLLHMDGTDASTVFIDDNGIAPYTP